MELRIIDRDGKEERRLKFPREFQVFPEDTIFDLRHKIAAVTGIPIYAQFLYRTTGETFHTLMTENSQKIGVSARELYEPPVLDELGFGITIDKYIYDNRLLLRVETIEHYATAEIIPGQVLYITDLRLFVQEIKYNMRPNVMEYVYYGFIIRYWPILSFEAFNDFMYKNENEMLRKYPKLAPNDAQMLQQVKLIRRLYECTKPAELSMSINNAIMISHPFMAPINTYNLFDYYELDEKSVPISRHITRDGAIVQKEFYERTFNMYIDFPVQFRAPGSTTFCIITDEGDQIFIMFEETSFQIKMIMGKVKLTSFKVQLELARKYVNPFLDKVNGYIMHLSAAELLHINDKNIEYGTISLVLYWRQHVTAAAFEKFYKNILEEYIRAGIFQIIEQSFKGMRNLYFIKGPVGSMRQIDFKTNYFFNYYSFLTDSDVATLWKNTYHGSYIKITHTQGDIRFEVNNIRHHLILLVRRYISTMMAVHAKELIETKDLRNMQIKKLRRLHEYDPVLYKLRDNKLENADKLYSVICQEPNQPIIYTPGEASVLPVTRRKKLTEYWNFTMKEPAYYECTHPDFPNLMFITGKHPDGYCLPCCKKRAIENIKRNSDIFDKCVRDHIYAADEMEGDSRNRYYIFEYSRTALAPGRFGSVPYFHEFTNSQNVVSVGVDQVNISSREYGFVRALMYIFGFQTIGEFIARVSEGVNEKLRTQIYKTWVTPQAGQIYDLKWINLFTKMCCITFRVQPYVVSVVDANLSFDTLVGIEMSNVCYILRKTNDINTSYEPIVRMSEDLEEVEQTIWKAPRIEAKKPIADKYITFMNNVIGGIRAEKFLPRDTFTIGDKTEKISLLDGLRETPPLTHDALSGHVVAQVDDQGKVWAHSAPQLILGVDSLSSSTYNTRLKWQYPLNEVITTLDDQTEPHEDDRSRELNQSYYKLLFYEMVISEFHKQLYAVKNMDIRERALEYIRDKKDIELRKLINNEKDFKTIMYQRNEYKLIDKLREVMNETQYHFDYFADIFTMELGRQRKVIDEILSRFIEETDEIPCVENNYLMYKPRKLKMCTRLVGSREKLISMLQTDINNPLKKYIFIYGLPVRTIHPFVFKTRAREIIKYLM
jgi:hypothetical protein